MIKRLQKIFIGLLVKHLYRALLPEDILQIEFTPNELNPIIRYQGKALDQDRLTRLVDDVTAFEDSFLWKYLRNNIRYVSQEKMFPSSSVDNDLLFGKAMLYNLKVIEDSISDIKKLNL